jgi:hypothetical protein
VRFRFAAATVVARGCYTMIMSASVEDVAQCLLVHELRDLPVVGVSPPPEAQPASYGPRERRKLRVRTTWRDAHESYYNVRSSCRAAAFFCDNDRLP